jgi:four helix bundle protein
LVVLVLRMNDFRDLEAYKKAFTLSMEIFNITKTFPAEEKYSLIDQVRRSSRAVCACIAEAYRKRRYPAHFISKLTDSDMENSETGVWVDFSFACNYISEEDHKILLSKSSEIGSLLGYMLQNPHKFIS